MNTEHTSFYEKSWSFNIVQVHFCDNQKWKSDIHKLVCFWWQVTIFFFKIGVQTNFIQTNKNKQTNTNHTKLKTDVKVSEMDNWILTNDFQLNLIFEYIILIRSSSRHRSVEVQNVTWR